MSDESLKMALDEINDRLPGRYRLAMRDPKELTPADVNARFMSGDTFQQLVKNVKEDAALASVPLCWVDQEDRWWIVSGNHRVQAAIAAEVPLVLVLYTTEELSASKRFAMQLSHNSIVGEDDMVTLKKIWDQIDTVEDQLYSGLDSEVIKELENFDFSSLREAQIDFKVVTLFMLPEEVDDIDQLVEVVSGNLKNDRVYLETRKTFDGLLKLITRIKVDHGVVNSSVAFMEIVRLAKERLDQIEEDHKEHPEVLTGEGLPA